MTSDSFVHLHNHSDASLLDGAQSIDAMFKRAAELGQPGIAVTDHGNMFFAHSAYKAGKKYGVNPIIGIEAYVAPNVSRTHRSRVRWNDGGDDDVSGGGAYTHMTLLAETTEGMHNLFRLSSQSYLDGMYYKPRIDRELLHKHGKGIIATTGCPGGEVQTWLRIGNYERALEVAAEFRDIFGKDNFFVEMMDHGLPVEARAREGLLRIAKDLALPIIATNDTHYTYATDATSHDALLCVNARSTLDDRTRFKFDGEQYYLKTAEEMRHLFRDVPGAADNTLLIAERCHVEFDKQDLMPRFPVPEGETIDSWFEKECWAGLERRFAPNPVPEGHREQMAYETGVVIQMGFPGYFLVTADLIRHAKSVGIRVGPGRGSAAGAIISWSLGITELDPIRHGLLFERFLNPERVSMPDIDIDFDDVRRTEMIDYATEKYGSEYVSQLVTFGFIKAKQAIKDATRILGYPYAIGDKITKLVPKPIVGRDMPLSAMWDVSNERYKDAADMRAFVDSDEDAKRIVEVARGLEGRLRSTGVHAAGVILSGEPLMDHIPIMKREEDGAIITQFEQKSCEALGLLKMDFLGLRNLGIIDEALRNIKKNRGIDVDLDAVGEALDDQPTFELMARGDTLGVFQLDGGPMRALLRSMKPEEFEHISAVLALYRPGPMGANAHNDYADRKNGRKPIEPIHPELEEPLQEILGDTYGVIVYQEQVMWIAQKLAGYSLGQADLLRRAMGKKDKEVLDKEFEPFLAGALANGYSKAAIDKLWEVLVPFADYAFNRAHTAAYGLIAYWTGYLKANFPAEYMAALLTSVGDDKNKAALYLSECRHMGITVLPPDVNDSLGNYTAVGTDIRVGLSAIRNVGEGVVDGIIEGREEKGRYTSFADFMNKINSRACQKRAIESLVKAGAFDSLGHTRASLNAVHAEAVDMHTTLKKNQAHGQDDLFASLGGDDETAASFDVVVPNIGEWDKRTKLAFEREMLGLYVSDHPLSDVGNLLASKAETTVVALMESERDEGFTTIAGLIASIERKTSKKSGETYAILQVEDLTGSIEVTLFASAYRQYSEVLRPDAIVIVKGRIDRRDKDSPVTLMAQELTVPNLSMSAGNIELVSLTVSEGRLNGSLIATLKIALQSHRGNTPVHLNVTTGRGTSVLQLPQDYWVKASPELVSDMKALLGANSIEFPGSL